MLVIATLQCTGDLAIGDEAMRFEFNACIEHRPASNTPFRWYVETVEGVKIPINGNVPLKFTVNRYRLMHVKIQRVTYDFSRYNRFIKESEQVLKDLGSERALVSRVQGIPDRDVTEFLVVTAIEVDNERVEFSGEGALARWGERVDGKKYSREDGKSQDGGDQKKSPSSD